MRRTLLDTEPEDPMSVMLHFEVSAPTIFFRRPRPSVLITGPEGEVEFNGLANIEEFAKAVNQALDLARQAMRGGDVMEAA